MVKYFVYCIVLSFSVVISNYLNVFDTPRPNLIDYSKSFNNTYGPITCLEMESMGRLGNIMFQYATAIGICAFRKAPNIEKCVNIRIERNEYFYTFRNTFKIVVKNETCLRNNSRSVNKFTEQSSFRLDPRTFIQEDNMIYSGYFQFLPYFYPHADRLIRDSFSFNDDINAKAHRFYERIKQHSSYNPSYEIACMNVRRGDKTDRDRSNIYNTWSLSLDYYAQAVSIFQKKYRKLMLLVFVGGAKSMESDAEDREWTLEHIIRPWQSVDVLIMDDHWLDQNASVSLKVLALCPNIIVASSSFSWWGAYLAGHTNVIAPRDIYSATVSSSSYPFVPNDYYPSQWILLADPANVNHLNVETVRQELMIPLSTTTASSSAVKVDHPPPPPFTLVTAYLPTNGHTKNWTTLNESSPSYRQLSIMMDWFQNQSMIHWIIFLPRPLHSLLTTLYPPSPTRSYLLFSKHHRVLRQSLLHPLDNQTSPDFLRLPIDDKVQLLTVASVKNPYNSSHFGWMDIMTPPTTHQLDRIFCSDGSYPAIQSVHPNKFTFLTQDHLSGDIMHQTHHIDHRFKDFIPALTSIIFGRKEHIPLLSDVFHAILSESRLKRIQFVPSVSDQYLLGFAIIRYPFLFALIDAVPIHRNHRINQILQFSTCGRNISNLSVKPVQRNQNFSSKPLVGENKSVNSSLKRFFREGICFFIVSTPLGAQRREALRQGWIYDMMEYYGNIRYKFVVGRSRSIESSGSSGSNATVSYLHTEQQYYDDLLILPFVDEYWNLTLKVQLMLKMTSVLASTPMKLSKCHYVFKVDDDVHIKVSQFHQSILIPLWEQVPTHPETPPPSPPPIYGGYIYDKNIKHREPMVSRDPNNRHSFTTKEVPDPYFEPFAGGPLYFLSTTLIDLLPYEVVSMVQELIPTTYLMKHVLFKLEDVFLGHLIQQMIHQGRGGSMNVTFLHVENILYINHAEGLNAENIVAVMGVKSLADLKDGRYVFGK